jgi:hypothetical protein
VWQHFTDEEIATATGGAQNESEIGEDSPKWRQILGRRDCAPSLGDKTDHRDAGGQLEEGNREFRGGLSPRIEGR